MLSMKTLVQEFLFDCQVRNLSPRTIHNYEKQLHYFTGYLKQAQGVTIQLESPAQYNEQNKARCTCACHSFIGGLWVTGLNIMYYLFKVKYVCCYDMYATHGSKLSYGA